MAGAAACPARPAAAQALARLAARPAGAGLGTGRLAANGLAARLVPVPVPKISDHCRSTPTAKSSAATAHTRDGHVDQRQAAGCDAGNQQADG